jgi:hypothetical protein
MPYTHSAVRTREVAREIEGVLDTLCTQPAVVHLCKFCGSKKVNLEATISIADSERSWNVLLPVCPECDRTEYQKLLSHQPTQVA